MTEVKRRRNLNDTSQKCWWATICNGCKWNARYFFIFHKFSSMTHLSARFIESLFNTAFTAIIKYFMAMDRHAFFFNRPDAKILSFGMNRQEKLSESLYWERGIYKDLELNLLPIDKQTFLRRNYNQRQMCETRIGSKLALC